MSYIVSVEQLRQVNWGKAWTWSVVFPDSPAPFNSWFPAHNVTVNLANLEKIDHEAGLTTIATPKSTNMLDLKVSVYDDNKLSLHEWMSKWVKDAFPDAGYVQTVSEIIKPVTIAYFDGKGSNIKISQYKVFPHGSIYYTGSSDSSSIGNDFDFVIAETIKASL